MLQRSQRQVYSTIGTGISLLAAILWIAAAYLVMLIAQEVSYTVCSGPLLNLPPGTIHWPPIGHHLDLIDQQHRATLAAVGTGIVGGFTILFGAPRTSPFLRAFFFLGIVAGSGMLAALLWLIVGYHDVTAHLTALVRCL